MTQKKQSKGKAASKGKPAAPKTDPDVLVVNGWTIYAHPLFLKQYENLIVAVEKAQIKDPASYKGTTNAKILAHVQTYVTQTIPQDPTLVAYRQGKTLGPSRKHWFRAKFGNGRFRLFFRYSAKLKIIIFAWVNDEDTLRTRGKSTDAYAVFKGMLNDGDPPDDWTELQAAAKKATGRFAKARKRPDP